MKLLAKLLLPLMFSGALMAQSTLPDALIGETAVTQHEAALDITESQITDLSHTTDTNTQLSDSQVATAATNEGFVTGAHTVDTDTQLSDAQVETAYNNQVGIVSQVDAEAGTSTTPERWTAERVAQAIAALGGAGAGDLLAANNLSDLDNATTARDNLGVEIGVDVQAFSAVLAATTASFLTADETKLDFVSVTQAVDLDTIESDTATNNAKVTNATHSGDVIGSTTLSLITDSVSADELDASGVESELEAVLDLQDIQGAVTDAQVPNGITIDLAATVTTNANLTGDVTSVGNATTIATGAVDANEIAATAVSAGSYTNTDLTVDADGRITAASSGSAGGASALCDLTDIGTCVPTDNHVPIGDGTDFDTRALVAADISDLNTDAIAVQAYLTSDQSIAAGVPEDLAGFTEVLDSGADFNATTGEFTVPVSGRYLFTFAATFGVGSDGDLLTIIIEDSGAATNLHRKREAASGTLNQTVSTSTSLDLTVSDVIVFNVENDDNNDDVQLGQTNTSISITYLGTAVYAGAENAADLSVDASGFSGNLTTSENTAQKVAAAVDTLNVSGRPVMAMLGINSTAQSVNATSRTELDFLENTGEYFVDAGITHSTSTNPERIEVDVDSRCEVSGGIGTTGSTSNYRYQGVTSIAINGGSARDGYGDGYIRVSSGANSTTVKVLDVFDITGGQYFTVGIARTNTTSGNATTEANKTKLIVKCWAD